MANDYAVSIDIDAPPDAVWAVVGDPVGIPRWYATYVACEVDGDVRRLRRADGGQLVERILERDEPGRSYAYEITSGVPLTGHLASFEVRPEGGGSRVIWRTRGEPEDGSDLAARLAPRQLEALAALKELIEGG